MTRPTPPRAIPASWSHTPDAWCELNARQVRAELERAHRIDRVLRFWSITAVTLYAVFAAVLVVMHP